MCWTSFCPSILSHAFAWYGSSLAVCTILRPCAKFGGQKSSHFVGKFLMENFVPLFLETFIWLTCLAHPLPGAMVLGFSRHFPHPHFQIRGFGIHLQYFGYSAADALAAIPPGVVETTCTTWPLSSWSRCGRLDPGALIVLFFTVLASWLPLVRSAPRIQLLCLCLCLLWLEFQRPSGNLNFYAAPPSAEMHTLDLASTFTLELARLGKWYPQPVH